MCIIVFCLFSVLKDDAHKRLSLPLSSNASLVRGPFRRPPHRGAEAAYLLTCHLESRLGETRGILASLSLTCLSDFLTANMSMISHQPSGPARHAFLTRRQKNRSTRAGALVSRKAMQNYNRFTTRQNVFTKKRRKYHIFNILLQKTGAFYGKRGLHSGRMRVFTARLTLATP